MFTLRAFVPQTDVLQGKPRDFRAFQSSLGLTLESLSLFSKNVFFSYMKLLCALHIDIISILYISLSIWTFDFWNFLNNLSWAHIFYATSPSNYFCEFCFIHFILIGATRSITPMNEVRISIINIFKLW